MTTGVPHAIASSGGRPNPLVQRRKDKRAGEPVERRQRLVRLKPEDAHLLVELVAMHRLSQRRVLRQLVPDDDQLQVLGPALARAAERVDQPFNVLCGLMFS